MICLIGAGGVGKAVAFGLLGLGLTGLRIVERDLAKAEALAQALRATRPGLAVHVTADLSDALRDADGVANCTPVGMTGYDGTPVPSRLFETMRDYGWAFDAVYTPVETRFLREATAAGLRTMTGYELFFHQGVDGFALFCRRHVDAISLRRLLQEPGDDA